MVAPRRLNMESQAVVVHWLNMNHTWIQEDRPSYQSVAEKIKQEKGLEVSPHSIKSISDAFKMGWWRRIL